MNHGPIEERIKYRERFKGIDFDFRGKRIFTRYDGCDFVTCTMMDHAIEQLVFTDCIFKDCNIDNLQVDEACRLTGQRD